MRGLGARGELKKKSKSSITISLDSKILEEIRTDSKGSGLSINAYLNDALQRYTIFYRHVIQNGGIILPRGFFINLLELTKDDVLEKIFEREAGYDVIVSILAQNNIPINLENMIKYAFEGIVFWAGSYNKFSHRQIQNEKTELVFEHRFGIKWSKAFGSETAKFIKQYTGLNTTYKTSPTMAIVAVG